MKVIDMDSLLPHYSSKQHFMISLDLFKFWIGPRTWAFVIWPYCLGEDGGSLGVSLPLYTHYYNDCSCINSLSFITQCLDCDLHNNCFAAIEPVTSPEFLTPQSVPSVRRQGSREHHRRNGGGRTRTPGGDSSGAFYSCSSTDVSINYGEWRVGMPL